MNLIKLDPTKIFSLRLPVCMVVLLLSAGCGQQASEEELLVSAKAAISADKPKVAIVQLKNLLKENPDNSEARLLIAGAYLETGEAAAAEKELLVARRLGISDYTVVPQLLSAYSAQRKHDEIINIDALSVGEEHRSELYTEQAKALFVKGDIDMAITAIANAISLDPGSADANTTQAALIAGDDLQAAHKLAQQITTEHPGHAPAWNLLGRIERFSGNAEAAETAFSKAIELRDQFVDYLPRALIRIELNKIDQAQQDIDKARVLLPNYFELDFAQGLLDFKRGDLEGARASLQTAYTGNNTFLPTLFYLATVNFQLGFIDQAEQLASNYIFNNPDYLPARQLLSNILIQQGNFKQAELTIAPAMKEAPDDINVLSPLADALRGQGRRAEELKLLEKMAAIEPENLRVQYRIGSALLALNKNESRGIGMLEEILAQHPGNYLAAKDLVAFYSQRGDHAKALDQARKYVSGNQDSADAYNLLGLAQAGQSDLKAASSSFEKARTIDPNNVTATHNLAAVAIQTKDYKKARDYYNSIGKSGSPHYPTLMKLAVLDQLEGNESELIKHLQQASNASPGEITPKLALTQYFLSKGDADKARQAFGELGESQSKNPNVIELLGRIQQISGDNAYAESTFKTLTQLAPDYAEGYFLLSQAQAVRGDSRPVIKNLTKALDLDPEHFLARLNLAQLLVKQNKLDAANDHLLKLKEMAPNNPDLVYLQAMIARKEGNDQAAQKLFNSLSKSVQNTKTLLAAAQQDWDMGARDLAISRIKSWLQDHSNDTTARLYLSKLYLAEGRAAESTEQYEILLEKAPDNLVALNNLAWQLKDSEPRKALKYAEQAYRLKSNNVQIADTLSVLLMKNQSPERALDINDRITRGVEIAQQPSLFFHRAQILVALGRTDKSVDLLNQLLQLSSEFPEKSDALALLQSL